MKPPRHCETSAEIESPPAETRDRTGHRFIGIAPDNDQCLNSSQLANLERSFREWAKDASREDVRASRLRILLIFLLIRYTGAKLNEVLSLDPLRDIDLARQRIYFGASKGETGRVPREVHLSTTLLAEIQAIFAVPRLSPAQNNFFAIDPGFLRRKFYERAKACGFPKRLGAPDMIRKARGTELLQNNMPWPAVQMLLGYASTNLTVSTLAFTEDEIRIITRRYLERESSLFSSARNVFWGKIHTIRRGDIQSLVTLVTPGDHQILAMITNNSLERLALHEGKLISAEVKAPWVIVQKGDNPPGCSCENRFQGVVTRMTRGEITTEYVIRVADGTEFCAIASTESSLRLDLQEQDRAWALFNCYSVVLHTDV